MTIKRARQILGFEAEGKTDEQTQEIINCFSNLADVGLEMFEKQRVRIVSSKPQGE